MKLSVLRANRDNPRVIADGRLAKLASSIKEFPKMMALRPMVVDGDGVVIGGNMRLAALRELGYKDIPDEWVRRADELTEGERRRFIIADNLAFGEYDWEALAEGWDAGELEEWGVGVQVAHTDAEADPFDDDGIDPNSQFGVIVRCETATEQEEIFNDLTEKGYKCKVVVV